MKKVAGLIAVLALSSQWAAAFDISLSGPGREVLMYYQDGNNIVVKNCGNNSPVIKVRSDCSGKETDIPIDIFKENLKAQLLLRDYLPHVPVDFNALSRQKNQFKAQLDKINDYIRINENNNPDPKSKLTREQLQKELAGIQKQLNQNPVADPNSQARKAAIQRANALVSTLVDQMIASSTIKHVASTSTGSDKLIYSLLKKFDPSQVECGTDEILNGTYDNPNGTPVNAHKAAWLEIFWVNSANASVVGGLGARMKDCARIHYCPADAADRGLTCITSGKDAGEISWTNPTTKQTVIWKLVARRLDPHTGEYHEVWQDSHSLKLWGDTLDGNYSHYDAVELNAAGNVVPGGEKACAPTNDPQQSAVAKAANAGVDDKLWGLPTIQEFEQADNDGITYVLPTGKCVWSSSLANANVSNVARDFCDGLGFVDGYSSIPAYTTYINYRENYGSVRCIGR